MGPHRGGLGAAAPIGGGPRVRAGTLRADMKPVAIRPGDTAAAGADRDQFYRRQRDRKAVVEERAGVFFEGIAVDQTDIETCAAHVSRDDLVVAELIAEKTCRYQPADRT